MDALLDRFPGLGSIPRAALGVRATPVERHSIAGLPVLVKRDDRTSAAYGGNKVRSLELLLAPPCRRVLTFSSLSAHHAYATALHSARLGIACDAVIVRRGVRGAARAALDRVAARVVEVGGAWGAAAAALRLWRPGTRIIPPGGASPRGAVGYLAAAFELGEVPSRVFVPLGTGTTVSGLLAGFMLLGTDVEVVAVRVADPLLARRGSLWRRAFRAASLLRRADPTVPRADRGDVRLRIVRAAGAYGEATREACAAVEAAAGCGLRLEPTYTGKTLAVLLAERAADALFVNTYAPLASLHC